MDSDQYSFTEEERAAVYKAILSRRDVRSEFLDQPISDEVLRRILNAAHHAPSVGFMQPWDFLLVRSKTVRKQVHELFTKANAEAVERFSGEQESVVP